MNRPTFCTVWRIYITIVSWYFSQNDIQECWFKIIKSIPSFWLQHYCTRANQLKGISTQSTIMVHANKTIRDHIQYSCFLSLPSSLFPVTLRCTSRSLHKIPTLRLFVWDAPRLHPTKTVRMGHGMYGHNFKRDTNPPWPAAVLPKIFACIDGVMWLRSRESSS